MAAWRAVLAGILLVGLGAGIAFVLLTADDGGSATPPTLASTVAPDEPATTSGLTVTIPPATTAQPSIVASTVVTTPDVVIAMQDALAAWGQFAVSGQLDDLGDHFVVGGAQRRQLRSESASIQAAPPGPPPYVVTTGDVFSISVAADDVVLRTDVTWSRPGEDDQTFTWDIQMRRVEGRWRLLTVAAAPAEAG